MQPLGVGERLFAALHRFTATNVTRVVQLDGLIAPRDLKHAVRTLQARHPLMRAAIVEHPAPYFLLDGARSVSIHLVRRRDDHHWRDYLGELLNRRLPYSPGPLFEVHYLSAESSRNSELIIVGEHAACDGVSMNSLAAELLELCTRAPSRAPRKRAPVLDELLPQASASEVARGFGAALTKFARVALHRRLHEQRIAGITSAHEFASFERNETLRLVEQARRHDTTVTGALMAAVMLAIRERTPNTPRLALSVPVNLRPRLLHVDLSPEDLGNYTGAVYLETHGRNELWSLSRTLKGELDRAVNGEQLLAAAPLVYRMGSLLVRENKPALAHAMLSNSGVVPIKRDYGPFKATAFYSATSAPMVSADMCFFCNTFDGRLCVNLVFALEVLSRRDAAAVLARVRALLTHS